MLAGDSRQLIDQRVLSDPRVSYYWDSKAVVGKWFATHVTHQPGTSWDAFYLYGPQAHWDSEPDPLVASGSSIIGAKDDLLSGFNRLQATPAAVRVEKTRSDRS